MTSGCSRRAITSGGPAANALGLRIQAGNRLRPANMRTPNPVCKAWSMEKLPARRNQRSNYTVCQGLNLVNGRGTGQRVCWRAGRLFLLPKNIFQVAERSSGLKRNHHVSAHLTRADDFG